MRKADEKRLDLIAFGAANRADVDTLAQQLATAGVTLVNEPGDARRPPAAATVSASSTSTAAPSRSPPTSPSAATARSRSGSRSRSGCRTSCSTPPNPEATVAFYEKHLSFKLSDTLFHPRMGEMMWFLRTNDWHHSLAVARGPHTSLHHASFEMRGIDEYMRGTGRLLRAGVEKIWGPGRHQAGNNTFTYFLDPHGNTIEYTTELELIDEDTWHPHLYDFSNPEVSDQWGTANAMDEFVAKRSFNDKDNGLFVPPPV